jgi:hypothetical protein
MKDRLYHSQQIKDFITLASKAEDIHGRTNKDQSEICDAVVAAMSKTCKAKVNQHYLLGQSQTELVDPVTVNGLIGEKIKLIWVLFLLERFYHILLERFYHRWWFLEYGAI